MCESSLSQQLAGVSSFVYLTDPFQPSTFRTTRHTDTDRHQLQTSLQLTPANLISCSSCQPLNLSLIPKHQCSLNCVCVTRLQLLTTPRLDTSTTRTSDARISSTTYTPVPPATSSFSSSSRRKYDPVNQCQSSGSKRELDEVHRNRRVQPFGSSFPSQVSQPHPVCVFHLTPSFIEGED